MTGASVYDLIASHRVLQHLSDQQDNNPRLCAVILAKKRMIVKLARIVILVSPPVQSLVGGDLLSFVRTYTVTREENDPGYKKD